MKIIYAHYRDRGSNLVELLMALIILAILVSISLPSFNSMLEKERGETALLRLARLINLARASAITTGSTVTVCRSVTGSSCAGSWHEGVIVFTDKNIDHRINQQDRLISQLQFLHLPGTIKWRAFGNRQYLQFDNQGFTLNQNGNFTYCPANKSPQLAHQLVINRTGRMRMAIDSDDDNIREDSQGKPLRCQ